MCATIKILRNLESLQAWRNTHSEIAFVPTMGCLHRGHMRLIDEALKNYPIVIVSIFVNPLQFGPNEDFDAYPRVFEQDVEKLEQAGVSAVFYPHTQDLYPTDQEPCYVEPSDLQHALCGAFRPGHFRGVLTVVAKLFHLVRPQAAFFGEKDYQQLSLVRHMVESLYFPVKIVGVPTVRESDGLALSSRNIYLDPSERQKASQLYQILCDIKKLIHNKTCPDVYIKEAYKLLERNSWVVDYIEIRHAHTLRPYVHDESQVKDLVVLIAARLGRTRLIDNVLVSFS
jgi:pantoate--beta-alanine ligase